jgi:hypothetical protein
MRDRKEKIMRRESDFDRKGCIFVTWLIVAVVACQEIGLLINGDWILAIAIQLALPLLILIPWGIIQMLTWISNKTSNEDKRNTDKGDDNDGQKKIQLPERD